MLAHLLEWLWDGAANDKPGKRKLGKHMGLSVGFTTEQST